MAVGFNGSGDVATRSANLPSTTWTICGWVRVTSIRSSTYQYFAGIDNGNDAWEILGYNDSGNFELSWGANFGGGATFPSQPPVDTWFYFAIIKSGTGTGNLTAYFKETGGSWVQSSSNGYGQAGLGVVLHLANDGWDEYTNCHLAYVRIWSSALTTTELDSEMGSATPVKSGVLMDWPMADNTDTGDDSGNGYNLTFSGTLTTETGPTIGGFGITESETVGTSENISANVASAGTYTVSKSENVSVSDTPLLAIESLLPTLGIAITPDNVFAVGVRIYP